MEQRQASKRPRLLGEEEDEDEDEGEEEEEARWVRCSFWEPCPMGLLPGETSTNLSTNLTQEAPEGEGELQPERVGHPPRGQIGRRAATQQEELSQQEGPPASDAAWLAQVAPGGEQVALLALSTVLK